MVVDGQEGQIYNIVGGLFLVWMASGWLMLYGIKVAGSW